MVWAWIGALLIGLSLGLLGSGGSILTVPVLAYLVGEPDKLAIAESLGIVALISLVGALPYAFKRQVDWRNVLFFGIPGMAGTYLGAYLSQFLSGALQLMLFAGIMLLAAVMMFRSPGGAEKEANAPETPEEGDVAVQAPPASRSAVSSRQAVWKIALEGVLVGILTGLVGVGGGFLIVPALVLLGGLSMHIAIGTSLLIIALKSLSGFVKYIDVLEASGLAVHWNIVLLFAAIGIAGSFIGSRIAGRVSQGLLKRGFAVFLVVMGIFILWQNAGKLL